jgi:hypothetical protein
MAASYTWPPSLPENPQKGFSETVNLNILRTPMDSGPAKQRYRGLKPYTVSVSYFLTQTQLNTLESFIVTTLRGTARFYWKHPKLGTNVEARVVPQNDGAMYSSQYLAPGFFTVNLTLEILP